MSSEDALYAEAERVYRAVLAAQWKFELTGDYSEFPPELAEYLDDDQLIVTRHMFETAKASGLRMEGGEPIVTVSPLPSVRLDDSAATLLVCYDASALRVVDAAGSELYQGEFIELNVFLRYAAGGKLRVFAEKSGEGSRCRG